LLICYLVVHSSHRSGSHWLHIAGSCVYSQHSSHGISGGHSGQCSLVFFSLTYIPLADVTIHVLQSSYCQMLSTAGSLNVTLPSNSFSPHCYNCGKISAKFMLVWLIYVQHCSIKIDCYMPCFQKIKLHFQW
jgi:hypothetical protein